MLLDHLLNIVKKLKNLEKLKLRAKRTISCKVLKDTAYGIGKNRKYDGYQTSLASMVHRFFDNKTGSRKSVNEKLAEE